MTAPALSADLSTDPGPTLRGAAPVPCRQDGDLWFAEKPQHLAVAQARCGACAIAVSCLEGALERREPWGVWGGKILVGGEVVASKRGRGRPRRSDAA